MCIEKKENKRRLTENKNRISMLVDWRTEVMFDHSHQSYLIVMRQNRMEKQSCQNEWLQNVGKGKVSIN